MSISLSKAAKKPTSAELHLRADYAELLCLLHPDNELAIDDVLSFFTENADLNDNLEISENLITTDHDYTDLDQADKNDAWHGKARDWFSHLSFRHKIFGDAYPFYLSDDNEVLQLHDTLTTIQKTYLYLLLASNLRCIDQPAISKSITDSFEYLCALVTKSYLSSNASVHIFGTSPYKSEDSFNQNTAIEKITELAEQISETVIISTDDREHFTGTGDAGLDIVAWNRFEDNQKGMFLFFGQCACTTNWKTKQDSSNYDRWKNLLTLSVRPINAIFFPFFYRKSNGKWHNSTEFRNSIPLDRLRIIQLARKYSDEQDPQFNLDVLPFNIIDDAIELDSTELFF